MTTLIWHLNDLRLDDNPALARAMELSGPVVPVYCVDPRHFAPTEHGFPKAGARRARFLLESIADLRQRYRAIGSDLIVRVGHPEEVVPALATACGADAIVYSEEATSEELAVAAGIASAFAGETHPVWTSTLYGRDELPFFIDDAPEVFTNFRKEVEKNATVPDPLDPPTSLAPLPDSIEPDSIKPDSIEPDSIKPGDLPSLADLGFDEAVADRRGVLDFRGGESAALARLEHYIWTTDSLRHYKQTRNGMLGPNYSSKFSPWLANGSLSPRRIHAEVRRYEAERTSNKSTYWMIFELIWRDFFRFHALAEGARLFQIGGFRGVEKRWLHDREIFDAWRHGRTGVPFVDANMREMNQTGFMSNRGRQNVASFLAQNLQIDWRWGAAWFESCLLDHDPASNYGNWQYVSGVGHDPRDRWFNVLSQAERYDKRGDFTRTWCPELAELPDAVLQTPWAEDLALHGLELGTDYPRPILDLEASHDRLRRR